MLFKKKYESQVIDRGSGYEYAGGYAGGSSNGFGYGAGFGNDCDFESCFGSDCDYGCGDCWCFGYGNPDCTGGE